MTQPGQNIQDNKGDVIGAGVAGSDNVLAKNYTVYNIHVTPDDLRAINQVAAVPTEVKPEGPAGIQGNQVPQDIKGTQAAINQLLEVFNRAGSAGQQPEAVLAGGVQVSKVDLLLKKAALIKLELDDAVIDHVFANQSKVKRTQGQPSRGDVGVYDIREAMAGFDMTGLTVKMKEAYGLLEEANRIDPTNTEVLLHMAELLQGLTPKDPTDEQRVLLRAFRLLQEPRDDTERFRLARVTLLLATSYVPHDADLLREAREAFARLGRAAFVKTCDDLLAANAAGATSAPQQAAPSGPAGTDPGRPQPPSVSGSTGKGRSRPKSPPPFDLDRAADLIKSGKASGYPQPPPRYGGPLAQMPFQPVGRWHIQVGDAMGSTMDVNLAPNGTFMAQQTAMGMNIQAAGQWAFAPQNQMLQLQGVVNGFQPFMLGIVVQGQQGNGYFGVGTDGYPYQFTRS